jgi:DNA-binding response OmpR family regulator
VTKFQEWHPDFIWMDVRMPVMDGYEATKKIRALPGGDQVKIVAVTASVVDDPQHVIQATAVDAVVLKPFRNQEILEVMGWELGVEYVYRDHRPKVPVQPEGTEFRAEMLANLPRSYCRSLTRPHWLRTGRRLWR